MSISLPEHFEDFSAAQQKGFLAIKELKEQGKQVCGSFCQYTPAEIIMAAGLYQVGLCGRSHLPIKTAETQLPANLCPLIKASYGHALEQSCRTSSTSARPIGTPARAPSSLIPAAPASSFQAVVWLLSATRPSRLWKSWADASSVMKAAAVFPPAAV